MQEIVEGQGSIVGSIAPTSDANGDWNGAWVEVGGDVSGYAGPGVGISGDFAGGGSYTFQPITTADPMPEALRELHTQWVEYMFQ